MRREVDQQGYVAAAAAAAAGHHVCDVSRCRNQSANVAYVV